MSTSFSIVVLALAVVMLVLLPIPAVVAWVRRMRKRANVLVLSLVGMALPLFFFIGLMVVRPETQAAFLLLFGTILLGSAIWVLALVWSFVGKSATADQRGFTVLPAHPVSPESENSPRE